MTDRPEIEPMDAEEWAETLNGRAFRGCVWINRENGTIDIDTTGGEYLATPYAPAAIIAIANAALPDDSPYKITRADVANILRAVGAIENEDKWPYIDTDLAASLRALAANLAALLPPEPR